MNDIGLHDSIYSPGSYISEDEFFMIAAYVDDCIIAAKNEDKSVKYMSLLKNKFTLKKLSFMLNGKLEMDILGLDLNYNRDKGIIQLNITNYIEKILKNIKNLYPKRRKLIAYLIFISMS